MTKVRSNVYFLLMLGLTATGIAIAAVSVRQPNTSSPGPSLIVGAPAVQGNGNGGLREGAKAKGHYVIYRDDPKWKVRQELKTLVKNSSQVVTGIPQTNICKLSADGKQITTDYVVVVGKALKGNLQEGSRFKISLPGGLVPFPDGTKAEVRAPTFRKMVNGRSYILFLSPDTDRSGWFAPVGGPQGLFEISRDGQSATHFSGDLTLPPPQAEDLADILNKIKNMVKK